MLKAAKWGYGWVVERAAITPTAPEELRGWRADLARFDSFGHFVPFALSANGALGPAGNAFLKKVFSHVKIASEFSMRHSHAASAPTWPTTWSSKYWRQRITAAVTATNAAFIGRLLKADAAAAWCHSPCFPGVQVIRSRCSFMNWNTISSFSCERPLTF